LLLSYQVADPDLSGKKVSKGFIFKVLAFGACPDPSGLK
jgi:hypothetical protein